MTEKKVQALTEALNDLLGFASRNLKRAQKAHEDAKTAVKMAMTESSSGDLLRPRGCGRARCGASRKSATMGYEFAGHIIELKMQEAREHEAQRFFMVVRDRVAEALR